MQNPGHVSIEDASWSPDGTRIAMVGDFGMQGADDPAKWIALLTIGADGTGLRVLVGRRDDGSLAGLGISRGDISAGVAACREGVAVPDPDANPGLVKDCEGAVGGAELSGGTWRVELVHRQEHQRVGWDRRGRNAAARVGALADKARAGW